jgi:hypothetical protein
MARFVSVKDLSNGYHQINVDHVVRITGSGDKWQLILSVGELLEIDAFSRDKILDEAGYVPSSVSFELDAADQDGMLDKKGGKTTGGVIDGGTV